MSTTNVFQRTPILLWPIVLAWKLVSTLVELTGILLAFAVGFVFIVAGVALCMTVIGSIIGLPLLFLGIMITLRAIF